MAARGRKPGHSGRQERPQVDSALQVLERLETGLVRVNAMRSGVDFCAPFGGTGASGYGMKEQGKAAMHFYSRTQSLTISPSGLRS